MILHEALTRDTGLRGSRTSLELQFRRKERKNLQSAASVFADRIFFVLATASCQLCEKSHLHRKSQTVNKVRKHQLLRSAVPETEMAVCSHSEIGPMSSGTTVQLNGTSDASFRTSRPASFSCAFMQLQLEDITGSPQEQGHLEPLRPVTSLVCRFRDKMPCALWPETRTSRTAGVLQLEASLLIGQDIAACLHCACSTSRFRNITISA